MQRTAPRSEAAHCIVLLRFGLLTLPWPPTLAANGTKKTSVPPWFSPH